MVVIRIVFLSLMVVLPIGCESTQSDLGVAEKLLKKFDEQYGSDCQFLYVQLQANGRDRYQCLLQYHKNGFRYSFDYMGRETDIGNGLGGWLERPAYSNVDMFRQRFLKKDIEFNRFLGENPDYYFQLNFRNDFLVYSHDGIILNDNHTPSNISPSKNIRLAGVLTGLGPIISDGASLSRALKKADLIKVYTLPDNPIFEDSQEIIFRIPDMVDSEFSVFVSNSHGMVVGVEKRDLEGIVRSRYENFYRETSAGIEPDYQLFYLKSDVGERLERCLVFLNFAKEFEFDQDRCYMSFFGYPEPPLLKPKFNFRTIIMACVLLGIVIFIVAYSYRKFSQ